ERSPIRARVASVKRVLVIQLDHDLDSFLARARPLWGASSATTFGESQRILAWFGEPKTKRGYRAGNAGERRLLLNPGLPFLLRLDFFGWHDTVCLSSFGRSKPRSHPCSGESPL